MASTSANALASANSLKQRLLQDIAELQTRPYPNIALHVQEGDLTRACLILTVEEYGPMHLTITFPKDFPLSPPQIRMDSKVYHPNIFGGYICASILNTTEGYTPAYTLKSIAIQLLSFFSSDKIEQVGGVGSVDLNMYRSTNSYIVDRQGHVCRMCPFGASALQPLMAGSTSAPLSPHTPPRPVTDEDFDMEWPSPQKSSSIGSGRKRRQATVTVPRAPVSVSQAEIEVIVPFIGIQKMKMPDEILLLVCHMLEDEELMVFAQV
ncbi:hypothetical protein WAI453_010541 [Rhynchosporium graminicola]